MDKDVSPFGVTELGQELPHTQDEKSNMNNPPNGGGWRKKSKSWLTAKAPTVKVGFLKSKVSFEKGLASVGTFTKEETKLLMSKAKRRLYCKNDKMEDPEFIATLQLVEKWRVALEAQRSCFQRAIKHQNIFMDSQRQLGFALQQVPERGVCRKQYLELGVALQSRAGSLVPAVTLEKLANQVDELLKGEYAEIQMLKKKYQIAKNDADVCAAKIENNAENQQLHIEMGRVTERYMQYKAEITDICRKLLEKQNQTISPILHRAFSPDQGLSLDEGLSLDQGISLERNLDGELR